MNKNEIVIAIQRGELDQALFEIQEACKHRQKRATAAKLSPGALVQLKNLRPKCICGEPAVVVRVNTETASIKFDPPVRRGSKIWRECRAPISCITVIAEAPEKTTA